MSKRLRGCPKLGHPRHRCHGSSCSAARNPATPRWRPSEWRPNHRKIVGLFSSHVRLRAPAHCEARPGLRRASSPEPFAFTFTFSFTALALTTARAADGDDHRRRRVQRFVVLRLPGLRRRWRHRLATLALLGPLFDDRRRDLFDLWRVAAAAFEDHGGRAVDVVGPIDLRHRREVRVAREVVRRSAQRARPRPTSAWAGTAPRAARSPRRAPSGSRRRRRTTSSVITNSSSMRSSRSISCANILRMNRPRWLRE